jgi:hypothetical protein
MHLFCMGVVSVYLQLQEIIANKDNDHSARWLASVQFKNSITRHWRGRWGSTAGPAGLACGS